MHTTSITMHPKDVIFLHDVVDIDVVFLGETSVLILTVDRNHNSCNY